MRRPSAKHETNRGGYEPTLRRDKNLGDRVEIRIRDNGTGIPPEVKEKMFNPFFTTKPAGEGTGLGLSISHDIIVKQHGGSIEVDTQPGEFTEIRSFCHGQLFSLCRTGLTFNAQEQCPLLALSGHAELHCTCPLSGVKRTQRNLNPTQSEFLPLAIMCKRQETWRHL